jgi:hypothetical protein
MHFSKFLTDLRIEPPLLHLMAGFSDNLSSAARGPGRASTAEAISELSVCSTETCLECLRVIGSYQTHRCLDYRRKTHNADRTTAGFTAGYKYPIKV